MSSAAAHRVVRRVATVGTTIALAAGLSATFSGPASATDSSCGSGGTTIAFDGSPRVGTTLTATASGPAAGGLTFTWSGRGFGAPVHGPDLSPRPDLAGSPAHLSARGSGLRIECDLGTIDWGLLPRPAAPSIDGELLPGHTLRASSTSAGLPAGARRHYEWFAGTADSAFATGPAVTLGREHVGRTITVKAMVTVRGYADSAWSPPTTTGIIGQGTAATPGTPTISGQPIGGSTLQASPATSDDYPPNTAYAFRWFADGEPAGDDPVLTLDDRHLGHRITVRARALTLGEHPSDWSEISLPTRVVEPGSLAAPSEVRVSGTPQIGETLTSVVTGEWTTGTRVVFSWKADGEVFSHAPGAVVLTPAQSGRQITLEITGSLSGYTSRTIASEPVGPVAGRVLATPGKPSITGTPAAGQVLTAIPPAVDASWPAGTTYDVEWRADGDLLGTGDRISLSRAQIGTRITVRVRAVSADGGSDWSAESDPTEPVAAAPITTPSRILVQGTLRVGGRLTAVTKGAWPPGTTVRYVWRAGGQAFGPSARTIVLAAAQRGKRITVEATGTLDGRTATVLSAPTAAVKPGMLRTAKPKLRGRALVGHRLTVLPGRWTPGTRLRVQWFVNGRPVRHATGTTLRLTRDLRGKRITVRVTGRLGGYATASRTSAPVRVR